MRQPHAVNSALDWLHLPKWSKRFDHGFQMLFAHPSAFGFLHVLHTPDRTVDHSCVRSISAVFPRARGVVQLTLRPPGPSFPFGRGKMDSLAALGGR